MWISADISVDITIMKVRRKISLLSIKLAELVKLGKAIADKAIAELKKMISKRYTDTTYDKPNNVGDVVVGGKARACLYLIDACTIPLDNATSTP